MDNSFKIMLEALIDQSSFTNIQKQAAKQKIKVGAEIDNGELFKNLQNVMKEINRLEAKKVKLSPQIDTEQLSVLKSRLEDVERTYQNLLTTLFKSKDVTMGDIAKLTKDSMKIFESSNLAAAKKADTTSLKESQQVYNDILKTAQQISSLQGKQLKLDPNTNPEEWSTLSRQIDEVSSKYDRLWNAFWSKPQNLEIFSMGDLKKLEEVGYTVEQIGAKMRDSLSTKAGKIQLQFETGGYESKVEGLIAKTNQWVDSNGNARISTSNLSAALQNLNNAYNAVNASGGNTEANQRALIAAEQALDAEIKKTTNDINLRNTQFAKTDQVDRLRQKYQEFYDKNTAAHRKWGAQLKAGMVELASGTEVPIQRANQLEKELIDIQNAARQAGKLGLSFFDKLKQGMASFTMWTSTTSIVMNAIRVGKDMVKNVKEIDTAMTSLYKVTDETGSRYDRFLDSASKKAKELGRSVSSLVEQTAEWAKRGYSLDEAEELAKTSSIYANVGEVDDETAVSDITTAMKAFNIEANESITIIDKLNNLGNKYATSSADLGEGLTKSASALKLAGNDINQSLAMITGGTEITQNASEMGNAIKVMSMRIRGMKGELEELGEESEGIESISKIQTQILNQTKGAVNIFKDNGDFKSTYEIIEGIAKVYDTLSQTDQAALLETIAGKQRGNQIAALIQSFQSGQAQKAYADAINSSGSAMQEQERWLESIEAKTQQFEASWESLSNTFLDSGLVKGFVDFGTGALNILEGLIDKVGSLGTIGLGAGIFAGFKNFGRPKMFGLKLLF